MRIRRRKKRSVPSLNMASMPDLIFTVLFFFMIVTHMRTETPRLDIQTPEGKELTKPERRRTITNIYIGTDATGETKIQIGDKFVPLEKVATVIQAQRRHLEGEEAALFTVNIRADKQTPMGVITDVKQELRRIGALNIRYSAEEMK